MPVEKIPGIIKKEILFSGGLDESSQVTDIGDDCLEMLNWRLSSDGKRSVKRLGSADQSLTEGEDLYGYTTYYDSSDNFCKLLITESAIKRKVGAAAWSSIHSFSSSIAHPVRPLEVHGKQFIINEVDSRFIHTDGSDYQIGIDAPTSLPVSLPNYDTNILTNDCSSLTGWDDDDDVNGESTQATFDSKSTFRFRNTTGAAGSQAARSQTLGTSPGKRFRIQTSIYLDDFISPSGSTDELLRFTIFNGEINFVADILSKTNTLKIWSDNGFQYVAIEFSEDQWYDIEFCIDATNSGSAYVDVFVDTTYYGRFDCSYANTSTAGYVGVILTGDTEVNDVYMDYINVDNTSETTITGSVYKYAAIYSRSGNFGNKSNPIKSKINTATQHGSGLDDLTTGGTYTLSTISTIRVQIDGTGTPDTFKYSLDNGKTWHSKLIPMTTTYHLPYGITLTWAATTGHTSGDFWIFSCYTCSVIKAGDEEIKLTSIPTSSDAQVDQRKIYRTVAGGAIFFWLATINDNTTTTFYDNIPDSALGDELEEDHDVMPNGKFSVWWDNRLWVSGKMLDDDGVAMESEENLVYYSRIDEPESFDTDNRYVITRKGEQGDGITQMVDYKDALYVFKRNAVFIIISKPDGNYGRYLLTEDLGCVAPWSMVKVINLLMFLSHRGWEIYNGTDVHSLRFSVPLKRTLASIDTSKYEFISSCHNRAYSEVILALPYRTGGEASYTAVYNYASNKFCLFSYHKYPSFFAEARDSSDKIQTYYGTRDGYLLLHDSGYQDGGNNITARIRKGWIESVRYADWRRLEVEFEIPDGKILTIKTFVNFDKDSQRTDTMTGVSVTSTDIELRRVIRDFSELGLRGKYFAVQFTNAENLGGELKINKAYIYYHPRAIKGLIYGD